MTLAERRAGRGAPSRLISPLATWHQPMSIEAESVTREIAGRRPWSVAPALPPDARGRPDGGRDRADAPAQSIGR
jgi:hypothetical protein